MRAVSARIATLVTSRICHDLISPVGAIGNGVELLQMSGAAPGDELSLIGDAGATASARLRLFRMAFGTADPDQHSSVQEMRSMFGAPGVLGRTVGDWQVTGPAPRTETRLAVLAALCLETALVRGGRVVVTRDGSNWQVTGTGPRLSVDDTLWEGLRGDPRAEVTPAQVQFLLLPDFAAEAGRRVDYAQREDALILTF